MDSELLTYEDINEKVDRFCYDGFFHFLMIRHDRLRLMLCQKMIPERTLIETSVQNGELYGRFYDHKRFVLDILAKDEEGYYYNLEMQCGDIGREEMIRFQCYGFRLTEEEARRGESYDNIRPVRQMIINAGRAISGLNNYIHHFVYYDRENKTVLPYNISEIYIVQLEKLVMEDIEKIEDFDELMYLFQNDEIYDKIEADTKIREAIAMHDEYKISEERIAAIQRERDELARRTREIVNLRKAKEQALAEGHAEGLAEGRAEGHAVGHAEGKAVGLAEGRAEGKVMAIKEMTKKYVATIFKEDISELLNQLTDEQFILLQEKIFEIKNIEELKSLF